MSKKESNPVYSARVSKEIVDTFKEQCSRMNVPHNYIMSEYMKRFIVLNINRESYESPILETSDNNNKEGFDEIIDKE